MYLTDTANVQVTNVIIIGLNASFQECRCNHKMNKRPKDVYVKFVSASAPFTHA